MCVLHRYLNELRIAPNRWAVGLDLFTQSVAPVAKFFGLSLVRDYLAGARSEIPVPNRLQIRQILLTWLVNNSNDASSMPSYIENNIATVLIRCVKLDYPNEWTSAFRDIIALSKINMLGFSIALRVIIELDVEIVMFDDRRTTEEVSHNSLIKNTMREQNVLKEIVDFLCSSAQSIISSNGDVKLIRKCLHALATMIGWIDIGLIANNETLGLVYNCIRKPFISASACNCLFELVKKGMDPVSKVNMIHSIGLIPILIQNPVNNAQPTANEVEEDEEEESYQDQLAMVMDLIFQEVASCWLLYEEHVLHLVPPSPPKTSSPSASRNSNNSNSNNATIDLNALNVMGPIAGGILHQCVPLLLSLLVSSEHTVYSTVIPSLTKLINMCKQQQAYENKLIEFSGTVSNQCFIASAYITRKTDLLMCNRIKETSTEVIYYLLQSLS